MATKTFTSSKVTDLHLGNSSSKAGTATVYMTAEVDYSTDKAKIVLKVHGSQNNQPAGAWLDYSGCVASFKDITTDAEYLANCKSILGNVGYNNGSCTIADFEVDRWTTKDSVTYTAYTYPSHAFPTYSGSWYWGEKNGHERTLSVTVTGLKISKAWCDVEDNIKVDPHYDNTFTVSASFYPGTNNKILSSKNNESTSLWWRITKDYSYHEHISDTIINNANSSGHGEVSKTIKVVPSINANGTWPDTWPISGGIKLITEHGDPVDSRWKDDTINLYIQPDPPKTLELTHSKSRLTIKENWVIKWSGAKKRNNTSPIKGYRVRVYRIRDGIKETVPIPNGYTTESFGIDKYYIDTESTAESFTFDPTSYFKAGDTAQVSIYAYTKDGYGEKIFSGNGTTPKFSTTYPVENAGIMRVKVGNSWLEGQVYVKVGTDWKEAESVQVKTGDGWKESE